MNSSRSAPRRVKLLTWAGVICLTGMGILLLGADAAWAAAEKTAFQKYWALGWRLVNFLILAVILYKVAKDPAKKFFSEKRKEAEETLDTLNQAKEAAQAELDALKAKLEMADSEIDSLVGQLTEAASRNYDRIIREAGVQAQEIVAQAKIAAETELARAVEKLTAESAGMIITRTGEMLQEALTQDDHQRLIQDTIDKMDSTRAA